MPILDQFLGDLMEVLQKNRLKIALIGVLDLLNPYLGSARKNFSSPQTTPMPLISAYTSPTGLFAKINLAAQNQSNFLAMMQMGRAAKKNIEMCSLTPGDDFLFWIQFDSSIIKGARGPGSQHGVPTEFPGFSAQVVSSRGTPL